MNHDEMLWNTCQHTKNCQENQVRKINKLSTIQVTHLDVRRVDPIVSHLLTPREGEVLLLVVQGKSNEIIARELSLSKRTVENYLYNIYSKIYVRSRTEATVWAIDRGLVILDSN